MVAADLDRQHHGDTGPADRPFDPSPRRTDRRRRALRALRSRTGDRGRRRAVAGRATSPTPAGAPSSSPTQPPVGRTFSEAFPLEAQSTDEAGTLARFSAESLDTLLATKPFHGVEVKLRGERNAKSAFLLSAGPLIDDNKANVGSIVTLTDITERKRAEEQQTMMVAELNHRVKNILAIVQSVAAQTVRSSSSLENFADAFTGRLKALAIAHDILTQTRWIGIGLSELLVAVLAPYRSPDETRVNIAGPAILLPARAVVPLSMVLHELTTNAVKYGALSTRRGNIEITWQLIGGVEKSVELVWQERGGPKVKASAVDRLRHQIDRSRYQARSRWQDRRSTSIRPACAGRLRFRWAVWQGEARRRLAPLLHSRIGEDLFANPPQFSFVKWLRDARHCSERCRKKRHVVVPGRDDKSQTKHLQVRQDFEDLPAAQVDVEQRAIETAAFGSF